MGQVAMDMTFSKRFTCMQLMEPLPKLELDSVYNIFWEKCGHYRFYPPLPLATNSAEHRYLGATSKGMSVLFDEDIVVRGTWEFKDTWSHTAAEVYKTEKPWMRCTLLDMFKRAWKERSTLLAGSRSFQM